MRVLSDGELELRYPEHGWRRPIPVRSFQQNSRGPGFRVCAGFCCPFCLYRSGMLGPAAARRMANADEVFAHIEEHHRPEKISYSCQSCGHHWPATTWGAERCPSCSKYTLHVVL